MTPAQRDLLRRLQREIGEADPEWADYLLDDLAALLALIADLGGAKLRAEFERDVAEIGATLVDSEEPAAPLRGDPRHHWTDSQWAAEWRKREMEG